MKNISKRAKIVKVYCDAITFDNGFTLTSHHYPSCCEIHYADFDSIIGQGWEDKVFITHFPDLIFENSDGDGVYSEENSFFKIKDEEGNPYTIAIYNSNNGWYSSEVDLFLTYDAEEIYYEEKYRIQH